MARTARRRTPRALDPEPRLTSLERALAVADFWRERHILLLAENYQLKRDVLAAVAETLRLAVVVKEADP